MGPDTTSSSQKQSPDKSPQTGSTSGPKSSQVVLKRRRALPFFSGHPWVYAGAIERVLGNPQPGEEVVLVSHDGEPIARGLYNPHSNIQVRLYVWDMERQLERDFWSQRLDEAIALRDRIWGEADEHTARRLVFSEADGLSGLIVDWYAGWLVVQFASLAIAQRKALLVELLFEKLRPRGIQLRIEKEIRAAEGMETVEGLLLGEPPPGPVFIEEHGVRYGVDIVKGHKTGFYLDQRNNRAAVARYARGARVLDMFCYTGGFGLSALVKGGAKEVLGIDSSAPALALARENAQLNGKSVSCRFEKASAATALQEFAAEGRRFDVIVLDPPKLARSRDGLDKALRAYYGFHRAALAVAEKDALLATCCCSGLVSRESFEETLSKAANKEKRRLQIFESHGQSPDHPVSVHCLESNYLKCYFCRVV